MDVQKVYDLVLDRFDRLEDRMEKKVEQKCTAIEKHLRKLNSKVATHEGQLVELVTESNLKQKLKQNVVALISLLIAVIAIFKGG